jgi:hypothetical protein
VAIWVCNGVAEEKSMQRRGWDWSALVFEGTPNLLLDSTPGQTINDPTPKRETPQ